MFTGKIEFLKKKIHTNYVELYFFLKWRCVRDLCVNTCNYVCELDSFT